MDGQEPQSGESLPENVTELASQPDEPMIVGTAEAPAVTEPAPEASQETAANAFVAPVETTVEPVVDQSEVVMQNASQTVEPVEEQAIADKEEPAPTEETMNVEETVDKTEPVEQIGTDAKMEEAPAEVATEEAAPQEMPSQPAEAEKEKPEEAQFLSQPEAMFQQNSEQPGPPQSSAMESAEVEASTNEVFEDAKESEEKPVDEPIEEPVQQEQEQQQTTEAVAVTATAPENVQAEYNMPEDEVARETEPEVPNESEQTQEEEELEPKPVEEPKQEADESKSELKSEPQAVNESSFLSQISQVDVASVVAAAAAAETIASQDEASNMFEDPLNAVMNEVIETAANAKNMDEESNQPGDTMVASESGGDLAGMDDVTKIEPDSESAVADVVAAVEKATAAAAAAGIGQAPSTPKAVKKKPKSPTKSANTSISNHLNTSLLNTSGNGDSTSPTSQKRRKRDPCAPKAPLNGYLVYFNEERAEMKKVNPNISFGELTKVIAAKWKDLPGELKQKYINEAEVDKERYVKEMADYKKSDSFKHYQKDGSANKIFRFDDSSNSEPLNRSQNGGMNVNGPNLNWLQHEARIAGFDIPIFTEEFMDHCKSREHEMRQLRKEILELEQQNSVLQKHIDNMKQSVAKTESDSERYRNSNTMIQKHLDMFRQSIIHSLGNTPLPNTQEYPTAANVDDYIMKLMSLLSGHHIENPQHHQFVMHVRNMLARNNYNHLFELS